MPSLQIIEFLINLIQDSSEKDIRFAIERLSIIWVGDKPDEDNKGLFTVSDLEPEALLAKDKLREKKRD